MNDTDIEGGPLDLNPPPTIDWNEQRIELLVSLWMEGHPTKEIARRMGIGKNAVVGKARRLKLKPRPSPIAGRRGMLTKGLDDHQLAVYAALRRKKMLPADARAEALKA